MKTLEKGYVTMGLALVLGAISLPAPAAFAFPELGSCSFNVLGQVFHTNCNFGTGGPVGTGGTGGAGGSGPSGTGGAVGAGGSVLICNSSPPKVNTC